MFDGLYKEKFGGNDVLYIYIKIVWLENRNFFLVYFQIFYYMNVQLKMSMIIKKFWINDFQT